MVNVLWWQVKNFLKEPFLENYKKEIQEWYYDNLETFSSKKYYTEFQ